MNHLPYLPLKKIILAKVQNNQVDFANPHSFETLSAAMAYIMEHPHWNRNNIAHARVTVLNDEEWAAINQEVTNQFMELRKEFFSHLLPASALALLTCLHRIYNEPHNSKRG